MPVMSSKLLTNIFWLARIRILVSQSYVLAFVPRHARTELANRSLKIITGKSG